MISVIPLAGDTNVYEVTDKKAGIRLYIHPHDRLCGPTRVMHRLSRIGSTQYINYIQKHKVKEYEVLAKTKQSSVRVRLISFDMLLSLIDEGVSAGRKKIEFRNDFVKRFEEYFTAVNQYIAANPINIQPDNKLQILEREIISLKQMIAHQNHIIDIILKAHPELAIDEPIEMIESSTVTDYNVIVTQDPDDSSRLSIDYELTSDHTSVPEALMDKTFFISLDQLIDLKRKLLLKSGDIIEEMGDDYAIVKDIDEFLDTFKHKLRKIQKENRKAESDNISTVSSTS